MTNEVLVAELRKAATEIAGEGHAGWGNLCTLAADAIGQAITNSLKGYCVYCGHITIFVTMAEKDTPEGRGRMLDHLLACPERPEGKLIDQLLLMRDALLTISAGKLTKVDLCGIARVVLAALPSAPVDGADVLTDTVEAGT